MTRPYCAVAAAFAALAFVPSIAAAAPSRVAVRANVQVADLDLSRDAGRQQFDARLRRSAARACGTGTSLAEHADITRCRREIVADATVQLAARSQPVRVAQATPLR